MDVGGEPGGADKKGGLVTFRNLVERVLVHHPLQDAQGLHHGDLEVIHVLVGDDVQLGLLLLFALASSRGLARSSRLQLLNYAITNNNKTRTPQVGAISKAQKAQNIFFGKKLEIFEKKNSFGKCRTVPKNVTGGPFLIYKHAFCSKITKNPLGTLKKIRKKISQRRKKSKGGGGVRNFSPVRACM